MQGDTDRGQIRAQLLANRERYLQTLERITDEDFGRKSGNAAWTVGQLMSHLVWSFELLPQEVEKARRGKGMFNYPRIIRDPANAFLGRRAGRGQTTETLRRRYEAATEAALTSLEGVPESDFGKGAKFWGEGFYDVAALFAAQAEHLDEHVPDIEKAIRVVQPAIPQG